ncbi:hypothetical protein [Kibdelosporangium philippinense]|uniref:hypothetical protein n=1 Tax=Kibdelosporangium philippinense TaxID=211113 RepID=UPI00361FAEA4
MHEVVPEELTVNLRPLFPHLEVVGEPTDQIGNILCAAVRVLERGPVDVIEPVEVDLGILDVIGSECQERVRRLRDHHDLRQIGPPPWIDQHDRPILIDGTQLAYVELGSAAEEPAMLPSERVGLPANRSVGAPPGIVDRIRSLVDHSDRPTRPLDSVEIKGIGRVGRAATRGYPNRAKAPASARAVSSSGTTKWDTAAIAVHPVTAFSHS